MFQNLFASLSAECWQSFIAYPVSIAGFAMVSGVEEYLQMAKKALEVQGWLIELRKPWMTR